MPEPHACCCLQAIYYLLLMRPSPVLGVLDFYVLVPFGKLFQRRYRVAELTLRDRLGAGNFGQVLHPLNYSKQWIFVYRRLSLLTQGEQKGKLSGSGLVRSVVHPLSTSHGIFPRAWGLRPTRNKAAKKSAHRE